MCTLLLLRVLEGAANLGQGDRITERRREAEKRFDEICVKG
jgi:hypothetical protein